MTRKGILWLCLTAALLPSAGCVPIGEVLPSIGPGGIAKERPPQGSVNQVAQFWGPKVDQVPDIVHGGAPLQGLIGNIFLFGPQSKSPVQGNGTLFVKLVYTGRNGQPQTVEVNYPKDRLDGLMFKDPLMGWGYRVFLPWEGYQPWIKQVRVQASFVPDKGDPIPVYSMPHSFTLRNEGIQSQTTQVPIQGAIPGASAGPGERVLANQGR